MTLKTPIQTGSLETVAQVLTCKKEVDFKMSIANPVEEVNPWVEPTDNSNGEPKLPNPNTPISGSPFQLMPDGTYAQPMNGGINGSFLWQRVDGTFYTPPPAGMVQKDGAWIEVIIPGQGDPTSEQRLAEEAAKRKRLYIIGGISLFVLILLIFLVKALKKNKQN
jgi:hypothetical protein